MFSKLIVHFLTLIILRFDKERVCIFYIWYNKPSITTF